MFNTKSKQEMGSEKSTSTGGATLIAAGTTLKGDISSNNDLRIDGAIIGNIYCKAKVVIGSSGHVEGDVEGNQCDVVGKISGNIRVKDLLQLRGECKVNGNIQAGKLQVEPTATFNGQCHMGAAAETAVGNKGTAVLEMKKPEAVAAAK
jgi:cytoskeletal protein CcmA (bactofilin family)